MPNFFINVKEKGAKKAEKNIKGLNKSLGGVAGKAGLAAGGFFGAGMLLSGMKQAIDLAGKQEAAEKALETALGGRSQALLNQASALQELSVFGDEAIIQQQAFLASLEFSEDQIKSIIPVAMDLASATGMTLESAVRNTAKTFSGLAGELGELVPQLRGLTKEQMMAGDAVKVMGDLFGGQASSQTETMEGKLKQLSNTLGDAAEAFGELLFPLVLPLAEGLKIIGESAIGVMNIFKKLSTQTDNNYEVLNDFDLKTTEFRENLKGLSGTELILLARRFNEVSHHVNMGGLEQEIYQDNLLALNDAIKNNTELQNLQKNNFVDLSTISTGVYIPALEEIAEKEKTIGDAIAVTREERVKELAGMVQGSGTMLGEIRKQIKAKFAEMIAGVLAREIGTKGLFGLALAPIAAAGASQLFDSLVPSFATGGDFVTNGKQMIMVGDNPSGREHVQITPLGNDPAPDAPSGSVTVNVSGNVMSQDFVEGQLAEQIKDAVRRGTDFGIN